MKVHITKEILNTPHTEIYPLLDAIFLHFMDGRHLWKLDDPEEIKQSRWFQFYSGSEAYKKKCNDIHKIYTDQIYLPKSSRMHSITVEVNHTGGTLTGLTPAEARQCLDSPAYVVVENAESDAAFVRAMITAMKRDELQKALDKGWWKFEHMGGAEEVKKCVERIRKNSKGILRVFVLADSDSEYPGHYTATIKFVETYCVSHRVPFHILLKRDSENYLPVNVLSHVKQKRKVFQAFLNLSSEQQDFYDMKNGFKKDENGKPFISEPFIHVPSKIVKDLAEGFGRKVWENYEKYSHLISREDIEITCSFDPYEIDRILNQIEGMI